MVLDPRPPDALVGPQDAYPLAHHSWRIFFPLFLTVGKHVVVDLQGGIFSGDGIQLSTEGI